MSPERAGKRATAIPYIYRGLVKTVADIWEVDTLVVFSSARVGHAPKCRQLAMWALHAGGASKAEIAKAIGFENSTVAHSIQLIDKEIRYRKGIAFIAFSLKDVVVAKFDEIGECDIA